MLIVITYDISSMDEDKKKLARIAKTCKNYGQRVQNSVFECNVDYAQYIELKQKLLKIINEKTDSIRIYNLGNKYDTKIEHFGVKDSYDMNEAIII